MKQTPFVGRQNEIKQLQNLTRKKAASLVVVSGRRRIGKSRLIEEFGKEFRFLRFSGLPPTEKITKQNQKDEFAKQFSRNTGYPSMNVEDWGDLFSLLARETRNGKTIILFDEISWMGSKDPLFLGKLKNAWDLELKSNPELILILCGSISSWIEKNILHTTGFVGRISLNLQLQELRLPECNQLLDTIGFRGSEYDKFKLLSITGGIPRYLEEIQPHLTAEANIQQLCFQPSGVLFREFNDIFSDLFSQKISTYKKIVYALVDGSKDPEAIAKQINLSRGSYLSECLNDLIQLGFIRRDYTWSLKTKKISKLSRFRLSDNYLRFYLKYIEPNHSKIISGSLNFNNLKTNSYDDSILCTGQKFASRGERGKIESHRPTKGIAAGAMAEKEVLFGEAVAGHRSEFLSSTEDSIIGLQFENLVISNRDLIWQQLSINSNDIVNDSPFFQRPTTRAKGCQIDYLIQNRYHNLFICEIKFSRAPIGSQVIEEVKKKIKRLSLPRGFSCWPVLIHVNGVTETVLESDFFCQIINFGTLLQQRENLSHPIDNLCLEEATAGTFSE